MLSNSGWFGVGRTCRGIAPPARLKDNIIGGVGNMHSKEIEDLLSGHPGAAEAAVCAAVVPRAAAARRYVAQAAVVWRLVSSDDR